MSKSLYDTSGVKINEVFLTPKNIKTIDLKLVFESEIADIYQENGQNSMYILHIKKPVEYAKDNDWLSRQPMIENIDWFDANESDLDAEIEYINERL